MALTPMGPVSRRALTVLFAAMLLVAPSSALAREAPVADPEPYLVKDIRAGESGSRPVDLTVVDGTLFLVADDGIHGWELWRSDGTEAGTALVKEVFPGEDGWRYVNYLTAAGGTLFFRGNDGSHGWELWKSDGTEAGTTLVKDIEPESGDSDPWYLTDVGGTLFFSALGQLWKSDGTEAGTLMIADTGDPKYLTDVDGTCFFSSGALWKSDGTAGGTIKVKEIGSFPGLEPGELTNVDGILFFGADDGVHGHELWKSDGTEAGTVLVKDINPGESGSNPGELTAVNGIVFFVADDGTHGRELWTSDGTEEGTHLVRDIYSGPAQEPYGLAEANGTLFLSAYDRTNGRELWKSDGTEEGTVLLKDIRPGDNGSYPWPVVEVGGIVYFLANAGGGHSLWKTDGTEDGTVLVWDGASDMGELTDFDGTLFLKAAGMATGLGTELWALGVPPCTQPSEPALSSPHDGDSTCDSTPTFQWLPADGAISYRIQVDDNANFSSPVITEDTSNTAHTATSNLSPDTYHWRVKARNDCGSSSWSSQWSLTILEAPSAPDLTWPPDEEDICDTTPKLNWSSVAGATSYRIQVDDDENFSSPLLDESTTASSYTPSAALSTGTYHWRVQSQGDCGESAWAPDRSFTVLTALATPRLSAPADGASTCEPMPAFAWSAVEEALSYDIQVATGPGFATAIISDTTVSTSYAPTAPLSPDVYHWHVRAAAACGAGDWSMSWSFSRMGCLYLPVVLRNE